VIPTSNQDGRQTAILVGVLKYRTQFWKRTTHESIQQSLVEIGSVVSEEKIFFKFHPPFSIFSLAAILVGSRDHRTLQNCVRHFRTPTKMAATAELNLT
jgi:hypothetical protein